MKIKVNTVLNLDLKASRESDCLISAGRLFQRMGGMIEKVLLYISGDRQEPCILRTESMDGI